MEKRHLSEEHKKRIGLANSKSLKDYFQTPKGMWQAERHSRTLKGKKQSQASNNKRRMALWGKKNHQWKGDVVGYRALHKWVEHSLGKAGRCENKNCHYPRKDQRGVLMLRPKRFHWANISHKYKRDLSDWIQLCASCHMLNDLGKIKII